MTDDKGKTRVINEGTIKKGNVSPPPKVTRPKAPQGQGGSNSTNSGNNQKS
ncbi:hypothetical protein D3C85_1765610 [compost metagenome]